MSIFKESFRDYVKKQFGVRQNVISRGNSDKGSTSRLLGGPNGLDPGAFYSYGQKQCVIRLASMVDLMEDIGLDLGGSKFASYKGETFARNFILEGGVLSDYARNNAEGEQVTRKVTDVRGGFTSPKKKINLSYGDPSIAADPRGGEDGYGVVPMPGIVDATITTKSAYGSLRSAKVNFVCHNLRQLEILELLYMRPGYPVLMEWGWSPYIDNKGKIINTFDCISDENWFWNDNSGKMNQQYIQETIINKKESHSGNYDGFIGFVTNFSYTARPDGGFTCSTELISMGEVLDSLKIPNFSFSSLDIKEFNAKTSEEQNQIIYQSSLGILIDDITNIINEKEKIRQTVRNNNVAVGGGFGSSMQAQTNFDNTKEALGEVRKEIANSKETLAEVLGAGVVDECFIKKHQIITVFYGDAIETKEGFIRWDALAELINEFVIPTDEKDNKPLRIESNLYRSGENQTFIFDPILYCDYTDSNDQIMDVSCDAKTCILPHQFSYFSNDDITMSLGMKIGIYVASLYSTAAWALLPTAWNSETSSGKSDFKNFEIKKEIAERRIGGIFVSLNIVREVFESTFKGNQDASLGDFLKKLWDKINEQCPMHNFVLRIDPEFTNIVQVIDLPLSSKDLKSLNFDELFKFNVHSNDTIVREFGYDTQIPSALKATIAINAQSGATADDIDAVTFAAFNKSIKSRLSTLNEKFSEKERVNFAKIHKTKETKAARLRKIQGIIQKYNRIFFNFIDANEDDLKEFESEFGSIKSIIKEAQNLESYIKQSSKSYLKNQAIIPINLNLVMDGIAGIVIGNVFKVDETRLPKAYRKRRVAFVALGEEQSITSGQDWTTKIRGQVVLFPSNEVIVKEEYKEVINELDLDKEIGKEVAKELELFSVAESTSTTGPGTVLNTRINQVEEALRNQAEEDL